MLSGGCLCGAVRYRITAEPLMTRTCWCRVCQYIGAGSATVNSLFTADALHIDGVLADYVCVADSGNHLHRRFCAQCGTHVYAHAEERPQVVIQEWVGRRLYTRLPFDAVAADAAATADLTRSVAARR